MSYRTETKVTIAAGFSKDNSLNFMRLMFAVTVVIVHTWTLGGFGRIHIGDYDPASVAVDGFFAISGFLVTRSRLGARTTSRFLWHRALRILPGFWASLIAVAFLCAPLAWRYERGSFDGYLTAHPHGPIQYVIANSLLKIRFYDIAGTPSGVPFPPPNLGILTGWNHSMWTLYWEALCYLGIAVLALFGIIQRRRAFVAVITACLWAVVVLHWLAPGFAPGVLGSVFAGGVGRFVLMFLAGSVLYLYADRIPLSGILAACCTVIVTVSVFLSDPHILLNLPLAYLCIWLGIRLPLHRVGAEHDFSYGLYIYSCPIQQLAAVYKVQQHGIVAYFALCLSVTSLVAVLSWFGIERPALRLKNWAPRQSKIFRTRPRLRLSRPERPLSSGARVEES
ncbi:acetyltransferase [Candidatus Protofrankia californiensis]|uniref:Acetyltransferase n=1 Tax=Candidatus Protofrankia californiensis TaxID=1839754 RepID=A0A1C3NXR3_9ACTN|nr:acetyltransferase [Candidatus Protofrankia californiensis]